MSEATIEHYVALPYVVRIYPEPDGSGYTAEIPDLPGCLTCATTLPDLWEMIEDAKRTWIEGSLAAGLPIPEPAAHQPSGKLTLRLPRSLHRRIAEQAEREGVSMNQFITAALAQTVGATLRR
jgi:antitoxin HicB